MDKLLESIQAGKEVHILTHNGAKITGYITDLEIDNFGMRREANVMIISYSHENERTLNRKALIV